MLARVSITLGEAMALFLSLEKCVNFDWNSLSTSTLVHKEVFNVYLRFKFELSVAIVGAFYQPLAAWSSGGWNGGSGHI